MNPTNLEAAAEVQQHDSLPKWDDCKDKAAREPLTALEKFIFDYEPVGEVDQVEFRRDLQRVVEETAKGKSK